jgi:cytosine/adenosine deaminase-related metal-dependent hydrolase
MERREDTALDSWIFAARDDVIDCVWRRGEKVVSGGRHRDAGAIAERYRKTVAKLVAE